MGEVGKITSKLSASKFGFLSTERLAAVRMHGSQALGKRVQRHAAAPRVVEKCSGSGLRAFETGAAPRAFTTLGLGAQKW
ncbi:hypothetical protein AXK12_03010 [Cephaloticoccus capnophilus]|uniref:Uncharacterized protein n=1 Tax=Cephaloticoccus capnophilus TaxID=1548208 RepID=A0A139SQC0_9BACT|nr:hypothetical protein AXK12_03010 [Cephaloticoccus capnophilus]